LLKIVVDAPYGVGNSKIENLVQITADMVQAALTGASYGASSMQGMGQGMGQGIGQGTAQGTAQGMAQGMAQGQGMPQAGMEQEAMPAPAPASDDEDEDEAKSMTFELHGFSFMIGLLFAVAIVMVARSLGFLGASGSDADLTELKIERMINGGDKRGKKLSAVEKLKAARAKAMRELEGH